MFHSIATATILVALGTALPFNISDMAKALNYLEILLFRVFVPIVLPIRGRGECQAFSLKKYVGDLYRPSDENPPSFRSDPGGRRNDGGFEA